MSLEVKVYREFRDYQAKVIAGLSWRQVAVIAAGVPFLGGLYALFWWASWPDMGVYVVSVVAIPFALVGWWRRLGVPFEKYVGFMWRHRRSPAFYLYQQSGWSKSHGEKTRSRGKAAIAAWEAAN